MKDKAQSHNANKTKPVDAGAILKQGLDISQLGHSVSKVNDLFITWLESLGVAGAGQADEHFEPVRKEKRHQSYSLINDLSRFMKVS